MGRLLLLFLVSTLGISAPVDSDSGDELSSRPQLLEGEVPERAIFLAPAEATSAVTTVRRPSLHHPKRDSFFWVGPGMAVYSGDKNAETHSGSVGFGIAAGAAYQVAEEPLYFGADLGLNFWNFDPTRQDVSDSAMAFQLLPTVLYKFDPILDPKLFAYVGISIGPTFYITQQGEEDSLLSLYLEVLLRPGIAYQVAKDLSFSFEPKFGILRMELIFLPHVMANLSL